MWHKYETSLMHKNWYQMVTNICVINDNIYSLWHTQIFANGGREGKGW